MPGTEIDRHILSKRQPASKSRYFVPCVAQDWHAAVHRLTTARWTAPDGFVLGWIIVGEEVGGLEGRHDASDGAQPRREAAGQRFRRLLLVYEPAHHHRMAECVHDHQRCQVKLRHQTELLQRVETQRKHT